MSSSVKPDPTGDERLTIKQVASEVGVDEKTVRRWIKAELLPYVGFDMHGRYLISRRDLDEFVKKRTGRRE